MTAPTTPPPVAAPGTTPVLEAIDVSRWYGQVIGIQGISCQVGPGITGLLGLNGAGKSTLFKVLAGQLKASKGQVRVLGTDLNNHVELYRRIGFCPEPDSLYEFMTGREMLEYLLRLQGFSGKESRDRAQQALARCHLVDAADRKVAGYSKGMRQKIKLAQAMAHDPDILFLDEPFNGMDPPSRLQTMDLIRELGQEGKAVLLSSHVLNEVEEMTSDILLIKNGRIRAQGHVSEIRDAIEWNPLKVRIDCDGARALAAALVEVEEVTGVQFERDGSLVVETVLARRFFHRLPGIAMRGGDQWTIRGYVTLDDDLKSLFAYLVEGAA